ncbi:nicotinate-nucleotide pyrophosphorylase [carboxylating] [Garciella nitratireducens DSM 15102]|uniref:Probable nicotinate-nucleotide pyrophosphorylase [carboxylating] n=1 Tax=Garciella nitratireducens DSM 15102 TaxID=1121911 RepID=A0A1T4M7Z9_9FIRM|nr:nicotinate-nucleotide pyrophosphorylase [carboxylating] [Garciella nitratireducens DSM 15102]
MLNFLTIDPIILDALKEDSPYGDITTYGVIEETSQSTVDLIAKEEGILAGLPVFERVFTLLGNVKGNFYKKEGQKVFPGDLIGKLKGNTRSLLIGERTALNFFQKMSGIATLTSKYCEKLKGSKTILLDTRKTTPGLRVLEKYAVRIGGGMNHRWNLSDGILLKENHIAAARGIQNAVKSIRENTPFIKKIEVEVENLDMVKEALDAKVDIIMLDNMSFEQMSKAIAMIHGRTLTECSGNVTLNTIEKIAQLGVDFVSVGELTHSPRILDLSMKNLKPI